MGYPYSWENRYSAGIAGPTPNSLKGTANKREFDLYGQSDSGLFYAGFTESDYKSLIRASIQRILMTTPGERVMLPTFGCNLKKYVFDPNDSILDSELETEIILAIERWEPRVTISSVSFSINENSVTVVVPYTIKGTDMTDTINYVLALKNN